MAFFHFSLLVWADALPMRLRAVCSFNGSLLGKLAFGSFFQDVSEGHSMLLHNWLSLDFVLADKWLFMTLSIE